MEILYQIFHTVIIFYTSDSICIKSLCFLKAVCASFTSFRISVAFSAGGREGGKREGGREGGKREGGREGGREEGGEGREERGEGGREVMLLRGRSGGRKGRGREGGRGGRGVRESMMIFASQFSIEQTSGHL